MSNLNNNVWFQGKKFSRLYKPGISRSEFAVDTYKVNHFLENEKSEWVNIEATKTNILSQNNMEQKKINRKERKKQDRERKKKLKEEEKRRLFFYASKSTKIQLINGSEFEMIEKKPKVPSVTNQSSNLSGKIIKSLDNELEFPSLDESNRSLNSQEIKYNDIKKPIDCIDHLEDHISHLNLDINEEINSLHSFSKFHNEESKKVKKTDPITFDLLMALQVKKNPEDSKKLLSSNDHKNKKKTNNIIKNTLDGSAPIIRRGKERENPPIKRHTKLKSIILEDRVERKEKRNMESKNKAMLNDTTQSKNGCTKIHSRKFREYCDHIISEDLNNLVKFLLADIVRFQDNMYAKDPNKAKSRRRYVVGIREVHKFLIVKKISLLVIAPDIEPVKSNGGLNDWIDKIKEMAGENNIPVAFALNRRLLSKAVKRNVPVSTIGIINYQGSNRNYEKIKEIVPRLKSEYNLIMNQPSNNYHSVE